MTATIFEGDCLEQVQLFDDNYFDSIVTDPPYGLSFMSKDWDHGVPGTHFWKEFLRVAKPGAHMLAFGGTRTHHRLMVAIEDAGWEIRDTLMWVYGSGFPKSLDVSKAIDKAAGVERTDGERIWSGGKRVGGISHGGDQSGTGSRTIYDNPATDAAKQWSGWGTALKPAYEIIILARKPLDGTVANNVLKWGCGGINIDGGRVATSDEEYELLNNNRKAHRTIREGAVAKGYGMKPEGLAATEQSPLGRFPANLIHDGSDEVLELFPQSKSTGGRGVLSGLLDNESIYGKFSGENKGTNAGGLGDNGSAARFFYCAKASKSERNIGCENLQHKSAEECTDRQEGTAGLNSPRAGAGRTNGSHNHHPTVKPLALLQYLCRLITPPHGIILDPFAGSGSTGIAATREGFNSVLIEIDRDYCEIARARNKS